MRKMIGAGLLLVAVVGAAEAGETTSREWLGWSTGQRYAYLIGAVDATSDWVGLTCPGNASYALAIVHATEFAEKNQNRSVMAAIGYALAKAGCTTTKNVTEKERF